MSKSNDGDPPKKRRKCDSPAEPVETTKITDVNDDCLEHIFKFLTVRDLLNVADTSKLLNNAVHLAFVSNYGKHTIKLDYMKTHPPRNDRSITVSGEIIIIPDFPTCLKILRCFGESITKLATFSTQVPERERNELDRYLGEYCAESVIELQYGRATLKNLTKSFTKVNSVHFFHAHFRCEPADIQRCFPNVGALYGFISIKCVTGHFPHLERLDTRVSAKQRENFTKCLQLNPQLQDLRISGYNLESKFLQMISDHSQIKSLYLHDSKTNDSTTPNSDPAPVIFKTVKKFETGAYFLKQLNAANISIVFDELDELIVNGRLDENVVRFVSKQPIISKFISWNDYDWFQNTESDKETLLSLVKALPLVTELRLDQSKLSADCVFSFMSECRLLKNFEFNIERKTSRAEYKILSNALGAEWRSTIFFHGARAITVKLER